MAVKRISINWVAKLNDSKDLTKYGDGKYIAAKSPFRTCISGGMK